MNAILIIRDSFRRVYADYGTFIKPVIRFALAFLMLAVIQKSMPYSAMLSRPLVICAASLLCAFFPFGFISFICALFILGNMFEVSMTMTIFSAVMVLMIFVLYYGFKPGTGIIIAVVPLMFYFKIPYVVPVILGLAVGIYSFVPAVLGILSWNIIRYFMAHAEALKSGGAGELTDEFVQIAHTILADEYMYLLMFAFVLCICIVSLISRSSINHCWTIAVSTGIVVLAVFILLGGAYLGYGSFVSDVLGLLASLILSVVYVYVIYSVDFRRTEHLSYEDDDYYYYVKAVPKINPYKDNGGL